MDSFKENIFQPKAAEGGGGEAHIRSISFAGSQQTIVNPLFEGSTNFGQFFASVPRPQQQQQHQQQHQQQQQYLTQSQVNQIHHHQQQQQQLSGEERKKMEKERLFNLQAQRLKLMTFNSSSSFATGSADSLMKNIMRNTDDIKLSKMRPNAVATNVPLTFSHPSAFRNQSAAPYASSGTSSLSFNAFSPLSASPVLAGQFPSPSNFQKTTPLYTNPSTSQERPPAVVSMAPNYSAFVSGINAPFGGPSVCATETESHASQMPATGGGHTPAACPVPSPSTFPQWCKVLEDSGDPSLPPLYWEVWQSVRSAAGSQVCDTNRLYPILLSSSVPNDVLASIWTQVNRKIPGVLIFEELIICLSLVAAAQQRNGPVCVTDLRGPLVPVLHLSPPGNYLPAAAPLTVFNTNTNTTTSTLTSAFHSINAVIDSPSFPSALKRNTTNTPLNDNLDDLYQQSSGPLLFSVASLPPDDDFADFQSITPPQPKPLREESDFADFQTSFPKAGAGDEDGAEAGTGKEPDDFDDFQCVSFPTTFDEPAEEAQIVLEDNKELPEAKDAVLDPETVLSNLLGPFSLSDATDVKTRQQNATEPKLASVPIESKADTVFTQSEIKPTPRSDPTEDRYSAFRDLEIPSDNVADDFGDFKSSENNLDAPVVGMVFPNNGFSGSSATKSTTNGTNDIISVWLQVLTTCKQLVHKAFNTLVVNHGQDSSAEALSTEEGKQFAQDLEEIYFVAKRIGKCYAGLNIPSESIKSLLLDIDMTWKALRKLFCSANSRQETDESLETHVDLVADDSKSCSICYSNLKIGNITFVSFGGHEYHVTCGQLWVNCINTTLPVASLSSSFVQNLR